MSDKMAVQVKLGLDYSEFKAGLQRAHTELSKTFNSKSGLTTTKIDFGQFTDAGKKYQQFGTIVTDTNNKIVSSLNTVKPVVGSMAGAFAKMDVGGLVARALVTIPVWSAMRAGMQALTATFEHSVQFIVEWETTMARLQVVSGGTAEEMRSLSSTILSVGAAYGMSSKDIGEAATMWIQQGKSVAELAPLLSTTSQLSIITGRSVADSVEDITSLMKNYGITAMETGRIVDTLTAIDMKHAITTTDLIAAYKEAAPVASLMGVSFEKLGGIITATEVATRAGGSRIGHELTTVFTRLGSIAIATMQDLANVPMYLDAAGNTTTENTGRLRSAGDALDELALKWDTFGNALQNNIAKGVAGVRQAGLFVSSMQNWKEGLDATLEAIKSFNAGQRATDIMMNTTAKRAEQVKTSWDSMIGAIVETEIPREALNWLASTLQNIADLIDRINRSKIKPSMGDLLENANPVTLVKNVATKGPAAYARFTAAGEEITSEKSTEKEIKNTSEMTTQYKQLNEAIKQEINLRATLENYKKSNSDGKLNKSIEDTEKLIEEYQKVINEGFSSQELRLAGSDTRVETLKNLKKHTDEIVLANMAWIQQQSEILELTKKIHKASTEEEKATLNEQLAKTSSPEHFAKITRDIARETIKVDEEKRYDTTKSEYEERVSAAAEKTVNFRLTEKQVLLQNLSILKEMSAVQGKAGLSDDFVKKEEAKIQKGLTRIAQQEEDNQLKRDLNLLEAQGKANGLDEVAIEQQKNDLIRQRTTDTEKLKDSENSLAVAKLDALTKEHEKIKQNIEKNKEKVTSETEKLNKTAEKYQDVLRKISKSNAEHVEKRADIKSASEKSIAQIEEDYSNRNRKYSPSQLRDRAIQSVRDREREQLKSEDKRYNKEQADLQRQFVLADRDFDVQKAQLDNLKLIASKLGANPISAPNTEAPTSNNPNSRSESSTKNTNVNTALNTSVTVNITKESAPSDVAETVSKAVKDSLMADEKFRSAFISGAEIK